MIFSTRTQIVGDARTVTLEPMNPLDAPWLFIENVREPGELVSVTAGSEKYALAFTDAAIAAEFLAGLNDDALEIGTLETWVMKDAFLTASRAIQATRVMFNYRPGLHNVQSAPLEGLTEYVRSKIGAVGTDQAAPRRLDA
jgi:hypothetical protein